MLIKILMGIVWFVVFYFAACILIGGVAGGIAGSNDPQHAQEVGGIAGRDAVLRFYWLILGGSIALALAGTIAGVLPGTRKKPKD